MKAQNRRIVILSELYNRGSLEINSLAEKFNISEMTIRRDLSELEKEGLIKRIHGGAVIAHGPSTEPPFPMRISDHVEEKKKIGLLASKMVKDGEKIAIDVGTTTLEVARNLLDYKNLTIITTSIRISDLFINQPNFHIIIPGGIIRPLEGSLIGDFTQKFFSGLYVDKLFLGVGGIDISSGLTEYNLDETLVKRCLIKCAKEVIVVADSSKFNRTAFSEIAQLEKINTLVTDKEPSVELMEKLKSLDIRLIIP